MRSFNWNTRSWFAELENHECMRVVMEKIVKLFPTNLINPANRKTFHPQNFCRLRYWNNTSNLVLIIKMLMQIIRGFILKNWHFSCSVIFLQKYFYENLCYFWTMLYSFHIKKFLIASEFDDIQLFKLSQIKRKGTWSCVCQAN